MRVYFDTGLFIDYLARRGHVAPFLRNGEQRGRSVDELAADAEECLRKSQNQHESFTSSITLYEVENALYLALCRETSGISDKHRYLITSARSVTMQVLSLVEFHTIEILPLTQEIFTRAVRELELQRRGIKAADSLHIATAINYDIDLIIAADEDILRLDEVLTNSRDNVIRCVDSNIGKTLL